MISATSVQWLQGFRLSLHVVAACIWVGGQIVLAGLVPTIRAHSKDSLPFVARAFAKIAWPAYVALVATGIWNIWSYELSDASTAMLAVVFIKIVFAALAALATAAHSNAHRVSVRAIGGAVALVSSLAAIYLGVVMTLSA